MVCHLVSALPFFLTNAGMWLIGPLGTNFSEILIQIDTFSFKKRHLKMLSAKWWPFCLGNNELIGWPLHYWIYNNIHSPVDKLYLVNQIIFGLYYGIISCMCPDNGRHCYIVTSSPIRWTHIYKMIPVYWTGRTPVWMTLEGHRLCVLMSWKTPTKTLTQCLTYVTHDDFHNASV